MTLRFRPVLVVSALCALVAGGVVSVAVAEPASAGGPAGWRYVTSYSDPNLCGQNGFFGEQAGLWSAYQCVEFHEDHMNDWQLWVI